MTEQQQNIVSLFNTKDRVNMEIAEETAIATGNGVWFSNWIDNKIEEVKSIISRNLELEYLDYQINFDILHAIMTKIYIEPFQDFVDVWTDILVVTNGKRYDLIGIVKQTIETFDYYTFQKDLEKTGIKVNLVDFI